jgi:hypothetical protein
MAMHQDGLFLDKKNNVLFQKAKNSSYSSFCSLFPPPKREILYPKAVFATCVSMAHNFNKHFMGWWD